MPSTQNAANIAQNVDEPIDLLPMIEEMSEDPEANQPGTICCKQCASDESRLLEVSDVNPISQDLNSEKSKKTVNNSPSSTHHEATVSCTDRTQFAEPSDIFRSAERSDPENSAHLSNLTNCEGSSEIEKKKDEMLNTFYEVAVVLPGFPTEEAGVEEE